MNKIKASQGFIAASSIVLLAGVSQAYASQLIGAPAAWTKKGDVTVSIEHARGDAGYDRMMPWEEIPPTAKYDISSSATTLKVSYGVMDGVALSLHYGDTEGDIDMHSNNGTLQWVSNGGDGTRIGIGADIVLFSSGNWTAGANLNWSKVKYDSPTVRLSNSDTGTEIVTLDELRVGLGAGYSFTNDLMVYGGYFAVNASGNRFIEGYGGNRNALEEDTMSGAYIGVAYRLGAISMGLEGQTRGGDSIIGGNIGYKF